MVSKHSLKFTIFVSSLLGPLQGDTCLAIREVVEARDIFGGWFGFTQFHNCGNNDWYGVYVDKWLGSDTNPLQTVFGFSGDAKRVEIQWQDGTVSTAKTVNDSYMLVIRKDTNIALARVNFLDSAGDVLHSITA